jgi:hypothetical protein
MSNVSRAQLSHTMRTRAFWTRLCVFLIVFTVVMRGLIWLCNEMLGGLDPVWAFGIRFVAALCVGAMGFWFFVWRVVLPLARKQIAGEDDRRSQQLRAQQ